MSWLKDGQPVDTKKVNIRNSDKDSILFIRGAQREDSGVYEMTLKVDSFEDKGTITLQIVGEWHMRQNNLIYTKNMWACQTVGSREAFLLNLLSWLCSWRVDFLVSRLVTLSGCLPT